MDQALIQQIADFFRGRKEVAAVFLFGSHASGKAGRLSDIDLGILMKQKDVRLSVRFRERYITELPRLIKKDIHLVIMNFAGELIAKQIFAKGRCIVVNDPNETAAYKTVMYAKIADFSIYLNRIKQGFIGKTMEA